MQQTPHTQQQEAQATIDRLRKRLKRAHAARMKVSSTPFSHLRTEVKNAVEVAANSDTDMDLSPDTKTRLLGYFEVLNERLMPEIPVSEQMRPQILTLLTGELKRNLAATDKTPEDLSADGELSMHFLRNTAYYGAAAENIKEGVETHLPDKKSHSKRLALEAMQAEVMWGKAMAQKFVFGKPVTATDAATPKATFTSKQPAPKSTHTPIKRPEDWAQPKSR